ncbi:helix-turn-helix domain-containing protein [Pseudomonas sp. R32]|uniref:helix-turn-helix domain-containing protein n=1 Tax=Pseudomonas sp. R32 TaxID=1573704 RepID=UPI00300627A3
MNLRAVVGLMQESAADGSSGSARQACSANYQGRIPDPVSSVTIFHTFLLDDGTCECLVLCALLGLARGKQREHSARQGCLWCSDADYAQKNVRVKGFCLKNCANSAPKSAESGERLRQERTRLGLRQDDFAQLGGVNRNTQGSYEKGERNPDAAYLAAVAGAGVDVRYVITGVRTIDGGASLNEPEQRLLAQYRSLAIADQEVVHRIVGAMHDAKGSGV